MGRVSELDLTFLFASCKLGYQIMITSGLSVFRSNWATFYSYTARSTTMCHIARECTSCWHMFCGLYLPRVSISILNLTWHRKYFSSLVYLWSTAFCFWNLLNFMFMDNHTQGCDAGSDKERAGFDLYRARYLFLVFKFDVSGQALVRVQRRGLPKQEIQGTFTKSRGFVE